MRSPGYWPRRYVVVGTIILVFSAFVHGFVSTLPTDKTTMAQSFLGSTFDRLKSRAVAGTSGHSAGVTQGSSSEANKTPYFAIHVVDADTGRGIPLVFVRTVPKAVFMTDSAGYVAFHEPGLMTGKQLWVSVVSYGYKSITGLFDSVGMAVYPTSGGSVEIKLHRTQIAERLYRMTGYGIYRDSALLGLPTPIEKPVLNAEVAGSDTVQCARFKGKLLWMWQDTDQMAFPLGNFHMTGAVTALPEKLDPDRGFNFKYYTVDNKPDEFTRAMVTVKLKEEGSFPIWVDGLTVVNDHKGNERLVARYAAAGPGLKLVEEGLVLWNDKTEIFEKLATYASPGTDLSNNAAPSQHPIYVYDAGVKYVYYGSNVRVKADFASASDPSQYESFTCLEPDGRTPRRKANGSLDWRWEKGARPINHQNSELLVGEGILRREDLPYQLVDVDTGDHIVAAQNGIAWNPYIGLWVNIIQQTMGDTVAGEIWYATANAPEGPWKWAKKVATHKMNRDDYINNDNDLYNPVQHYELMRGGGRFIYFSGTYVRTFSGNPWPTPYYNYNNIMHRLDLNDSRLALPEPPQGLWATKPAKG